jgi:uncharacterized protein YdhG (YjbR/CyaY superfamily)
MQSKATTIDQYLEELPAERKEAVTKLHKIITKNLPKGFKAGIGYGMICYSVPHSLYPKGYHCDPSLPLPFMSLASQKNFIALYHMGIYADPKLLEWFTKAYAKAVPGKLDMGKSCLRFKKAENIPYELIAELATKMSVKDWVGMYESKLSK